MKMFFDTALLLVGIGFFMISSDWIEHACAVAVILSSVGLILFGLHNLKRPSP